MRIANLLTAAVLALGAAVAGLMLFDRPGAGAGAGPVPRILAHADAPDRLARHRWSGPCPSRRHDAPDGRDPWGGCFPGPRTTGVPAGTKLTPYDGPCQVTEPGTIIAAKTVDCDLEIFAPGVKISDSRVNGSVWIDNPAQGGSFTISDSTVDAGAARGGPSAIGKSHFVALRVETLGGVRGIWCEYDCIVEDSWVHGQARDPSGVEHESGIRMGSGSATAGQRFLHNTIVCDAPDVPPDAGCSADLTGYGDFATIQHNTLKHNLFGASTGGTCAYGGSTPSKTYAAGNHNVFVDNVFQRGSVRHGAGAIGHCGNWFAITDLDAGRRGNRWNGNRWDSGGQMPADG